MKSGKATGERAKKAFFSSLDSHFSDLASKARLQIDKGHLSAIWEQGMLIAGTGTYAKPAKGGYQDVGLIQISTPKNLPLLTQEKKKVPPGNYVIQLGDDGSVNLKRVGGRSSISAAPAGTAMRDSGGGTGGTCRNGLRLEFQYRNCQLCISLVCPGQWIILLLCFEIPFCKTLTGLFSID